MALRLVLLSSFVLLLLAACGAQSSLGSGFTTGAASSTCTSGQRWTAGNSESELMNPGAACRACHLSEEPGKAYYFMGTVFPTAHEEDLCAAADVPVDAVVEILDTNDVVQLTLTVNEAGNFRSKSTSATVPVPYKARVKVGGKINAMAAAQTSGDCNSCHTAAGNSGAPGRVFFPQ